MSNIAHHTVVLESVLVTQRPLFVKMAEEWINIGATFFAVCANTRVLASWPAQVRIQEADLIAPIYLNQTYLGEVQICGVSSAEARQLLQIEANLISAMIRQEQELNSMAATLVDTQDRFWALHQLTRTARSYLDMEEMLEALIGESADLMITETAFIWLKLDSSQTMFYQCPTILLHEEDIVDYLTELAAENVGFLCRRGILDHPGVENILMVPVEVRFAETAVIGMVNKVKGTFTTPDIRLARAIAEYTGAQIENVISYQESLEKARMRHEMELAHRVQFQLFPQELPRVSKIDFWAKSEPASHVGGDFYDYHTHANGSFTFVVGDVSGKGIASALLMAMTRTIMRAHMQKSPTLTPGQIIERANAELYDDFTRVNMFATVFVGQYDPLTGMLIYSNSGHSPVIYCPTSGSPLFLEADSTPMGILPKTTAGENTIYLKPYDLLVVGSDGLYEAHNDQSLMFGFERLAAAVSSLRHASAQEIGEKLLERVAAFSIDHPQEDDRTILLLKRTE